MKNAPACFTDHQALKWHKVALTYEGLIPKCGNVIEITGHEITKEHVVERRYVIKIRSVFDTLLAEELPYVVTMKMIT